METKFDLSKLRDKVLGSDDKEYSTFYVEAWDADLPIRTMPTEGVKEVRKHTKDEPRALATALYWGCATKDGEYVFQREDIQKLATDKSFGVLNKVAIEIMKISGLMEDAESEAKNG